MSELILPHIWLPRYNFPGRSRICLPEEKDLRAFFAGLVNTGMINAGHALANAGIIRATSGPPASNLYAWYRSDQGLYQDSAMTTPVTANADPVGAWQDISGNSRHILQATSGKRPTYTTNAINTTLPALTFVKANVSNLAKGSLSYGSATVFGVIKYTASGSFYRIWYDSFGGILFLTEASPPKHAFFVAGDSVRQSASTYAGDINTWHRFTGFFDGSAGNNEGYQRDGTQIIGPAGYGIHSGTGISIGTNNGDTIDALVAEVIVYNALLSAGDVTLVNNYLTSRYGL